MIAAIHQPQYLSWLGFFNKYLCSDIFILLDNVQFQKNGFQNRTRIKSPPCWQWLTVPVLHSSSVKIKDVEISQTQVRWQEKQWGAISCNYQKAPYFNKYRDIFIEIFQNKYTYLTDLIINSNNKILDILGIETPTVCASSFSFSSAKTDLLIDICKKINADTYLSGIGGKQYLEERKFEDAGIKLIYQHFNHPTYEQQHKGIAFQPNISVLDLIFNCGEKSRNIILKGFSIAKG